MHKPFLLFFEQLVKYKLLHVGMQKTPLSHTQREPNGDDVSQRPVSFSSSLVSVASDQIVSETSRNSAGTYCCTI